MDAAVALQDVGVSSNTEAKEFDPEAVGARTDEEESVNPASGTATSNAELDD